MLMLMRARVCEQQVEWTREQCSNNFDYSHSTFSARSSETRRCTLQVQKAASSEPTATTANATTLHQQPKNQTTTTTTSSTQRAKFFAKPTFLLLQIALKGRKKEPATGVEVEVER